MWAHIYLYVTIIKEKEVVDLKASREIHGSISKNDRGRRKLHNYITISKVIIKNERNTYVFLYPMCLRKAHVSEEVFRWVACSIRSHLVPVPLKQDLFRLSASPSGPCLSAPIAWSIGTRVVGPSFLRGCWSLN